MGELTYKKYLIRFLPIAIGLLLLALIVVGLLLYLFIMRQARERIEMLSNRIHEDLVIKNGKWDISKFTSDSRLAKGKPLYVITSEGFIIERANPINGLLDLSRYSLLNQYTKPTTVDGVTGERWRVLSRAVYSGDEQVGVILASIFNPKQEDIKGIDDRLKESLDKWNNHISADGEAVDVSKIEPRNLPYDISFQVVTRFNKVLFQSSNNNVVSRMPVYMDRSYIETQLKRETFQEVLDNSTGERYLVHTTPIVSESRLISGIVVTGESVEREYQAILGAVVLGFLVGSGVIIASSPLGYIYLRNIQRRVRRSAGDRPELRSINFKKKDCRLLINEHIIDIPYSSHQFYFCQALFQKPQKKWEVDELLEILGEDFGKEKWRKIYDTMVALNRKTSAFTDKLFVVKDKRYFVNPKLVPVVSYINS